MKEIESAQEYLLVMKEIASRGSIDDESLIQYVINGIADDDPNKIVLYGSRNLNDFKSKLKDYEQLRKTSKASTSSKINSNGRQKSTNAKSSSKSDGVIDIVVDDDTFFTKIFVAPNGTMNIDAVIRHTFFTKIFVAPNGTMNIDAVIRQELLRHAEMKSSIDNITICKLMKEPAIMMIEMTNLDEPIIEEDCTKDAKERVREMVLAYEPKKTKDENDECNNENNYN
ncbi:hypothetical protein QE152_g1203 [Popillia japonica]|uniref:Uncharacterized protein n=1 Tax=Popillia japonica TaxID=7064 RepID=A0AAW1N9E9_POPJA